VKGAVARVGAEALAERVVEGRPASRFKSGLTAIVAGAGLGFVVYRLLRSGESEESDDEADEDGRRFSSADGG
jgi:hypothetical protein